MIVTTPADLALEMAERAWLPDAVIRLGIRRLCAERLRSEQRLRRNGSEAAQLHRFIESLRNAPVAVVPDKANAQHYEVPAALFELMLGPRLKYSGCWWNEGTTTLADAEEDALALTAEHADIEDGMHILELGCGWGSLSLWLASLYPNCRVRAVSNSSTQRQFIERAASERGLRNIHVITADMNSFDTGIRFDRIVSVEMFEHMRNYHELFRRVGTWLAPDGRLFVHVFCHRRFAYLFEEEGAGNWMGRHFFSGGMMPSADLLPAVSSPLALEARWLWDGRHYQRTANAWLANLDANSAQAVEILARAGDARSAVRHVARWRIFLMACAEMFGYDEGAQWGVAHYRFASRRLSTR